jgi:hypothetical protein
VQEVILCRLGQIAPEPEHIRHPLMVLFARSTIFFASLKLRGAESMTNFGGRECFPGPARVSFAPSQQNAGSATVAGARQR